MRLTKAMLSVHIVRIYIFVIETSRHRHLGRFHFTEMFAVTRKLLQTFRSVMTVFGGRYRVSDNDSQAVMWHNQTGSLCEFFLYVCS